MLSQPRKLWLSALQDKVFRNKLLITLILLGIYAAITPALFQFIQQRNGSLLNDYLLNRLPAYELSVWIFTVLYLLIAAGIFILIQDPNRCLVILMAYVILCILRSITMLLFPLEPPMDIMELRDPLVQYFFYQQSVTKDLFFSGHTSLLVLLTIAMTSLRSRLVFLTGTFAVVVMLLLQHAHYTVDIIFAPLFSWLAFAIARKIP
jgi:hypothetical protein